LRFERAAAQWVPALSPISSNKTGERKKGLRDKIVRRTENRKWKK
jgi:hypothetical protein